jgi:hypothetical protein
VSFSGFFWFALMLVPLVILQRLLHREIQAVFLLITRHPQLTVALFSLLFFPGVFIHETSHFVMAKLLRVRTRGFSLFPNTMPDGRLQMGYVETEPTDIVRDSLVGLSPLIAGSLFVAYAGSNRLHLYTLWFAVSSTMMPSDSDRHAWLPMGLWTAALFALAIFAGAGTWMLENITPFLDNFLYSIALLFGLSNAVHVVLLVPFFLLHRLLVYVMKMDVR